MELTKEQYEKIEKYLPKQRGNVKIDNRQFLNAILYVAENGCKWRSLPKEYEMVFSTESLQLCKIRVLSMLMFL